MVYLDKRRKVGIEARKRLSTGPLVLHDAEEVYHLIAQRAQVACRGGIYLARNAEALLDQLLEAPAGTVAGEHAQIVQVQVAVAVGIADLLVVNLAEPVVCGDSSGVRKDKAADRISDGRVFLDAPVENVYIAVDGLFIVKVGVFHIAQFLALLTIKYICLCNTLIATARQDRLDAVLNILDRNIAVFYLRQEVSRDLERDEIDDIIGVLGVGGLKRLFNGVCDLGDVKIYDFSVSLNDLVHLFPPYFSQTPLTSTVGT